MSGRRSFFHRYRWWILFISTIIGFSIIYLLASIAIYPVGEATRTFEKNTTHSIDPSSELVAKESPISTITNILEPGTPTTTPSLTPETLPRQLAFVSRVIDGDSIEVILDGEPFEVRYIGIDAPEIGMPFYQEAVSANEALVSNQIVELESDVSELDKYGRLLRYVYIPDGRLVNAELVALGLAHAISYPPDIKYQEIIISSEMIAQRDNVGFWAPNPTPTPAPDLSPPLETKAIQIDPTCSQFNAPGNDNENKNGEYVCLTNPNPDPVNLIGWSIQDSYGWLYKFPAFQIEGKSKVQVFTGCGNDSSQELYWCKDETAVWNNDGDCVYLKDSEGNVAAEYCY